ncbi:MAG: hypothetical protein DRI48_00700 [Chloroflexi bacterium]|nr:MAG: hypothetical protein DRI48_00700 [Chloroflexota bacterium]
MTKRKKSRPTAARSGKSKGTERRPLIIIGAVLILAVVIGAGVWMLGSGPGEPRREVEIVYHGIEGGFTGEGFPYLGSLEAPVVMMEFTDFNCSHCKAYNLETEAGILEDYVASGEVRYVLHYYSSGYPQSLQATEAVMCAADQGLVFQFQRALFEKSPAGRDDYAALASQVGLDEGEFTACWDAGRHRAALMDHIRAARAMGVSGTPSFKINDQLVVGHRPDEIRRVIEEELAAAGQ